MSNPILKRLAEHDAQILGASKEFDGFRAEVFDRLLALESEVGLRVGLEANASPPPGGAGAPGVSSISVRYTKDFAAGCATAADEAPGPAVSPTVAALFETLGRHGRKLDELAGALRRAGAEPNLDPPKAAPRRRRPPHPAKPRSRSGRR